MQKFDYDVAVIGAGSGGYAAARTAADNDLRTVIIEGGKEIGGLCILRGCMPTKALLHVAEVNHLARHSSVCGVHIKDVHFNFSEAMARKNRLVKGFADYRKLQLTEATFEFVRANARFADPHTLKLSTGKSITAANFVISTGSTIAPCPLPFLEDIDYLTSDDALELKRVPKSMIVLGGGAVAVEFAQMFSRFGARVTLIQRSARVLHEFDTDATDELEKVFRREGIRVFTSTKLIGASQRGKRKTASFLHGGRKIHVEAEEVLYALGRIANTASLGLENAGVKTENFRVLINDQMRTSAPHIYAAGDCTGLYDIVHIAVMQGEAAAHNIANPRKPRRLDDRLLTSVVFTEPQVAKVGLTEKEALERNVPYLAASYPFDDHGKSLLMEHKDGFVKLLASPKTGEIIGGCCIGPMGGELLHEIVAAMSKRMTVQELAAMPHYHPTLAEIWTYPADELAIKVKVVRATRPPRRATGPAEY
jgi:pyruvate/2-oxoglutarate dehydrogenase complex dihydrolipoamide dehydrogenase (E3) component